MPHQLQITAISPDPALFDLPWHIPLEQWPQEILAAYPRGISRHVVRFVRVQGQVLAVKEIGETVAHREYELLRDLKRLELPSVTPVGVITGRVDRGGRPLDSVLITRHLKFSLPYRMLFSRYLAPNMATRLIDALTVLLVRLHLEGFYWGDVSLSNTLFRRDAGAFSAYLVDAETGDLHDRLTDGQRSYDLEVARVNIIGELMDLDAGGLLPSGTDPIEIGDRLAARYTELWEELTAIETFGGEERWRVTERIRRLNELGFDVGEMAMSTDLDGTSVVIEPKVVDAGHHHRRLMRLTGLDVQENQARRLLNDMDTYRMAKDRLGDPEEYVAHDWLTEVFEPVQRLIPAKYQGKLEPAEMFHEILEHRWFLGENAGHNIPMRDAVNSYIETVLPSRPDEEAVLGLDTATLRAIEDPNAE